MKISIVGTGYVGLVTGACLADKGQDVTCVDIDEARVEALNRAHSPIFESGLDALLRRHVGSKLRATSNIETAVLESDLTMIAVGTPLLGESIDLTAVLTAARQIGTALRRKPGYHVVVVKSTVVPGTTARKVLPALEASSGKTAGPDFGLGMNPEFLSEGEAVHDFMFPDRIVLGGIDERTIDTIEEVYRDFPDSPRIRTNTGTAELIKYASNALLANLVSFSNEIANLGTTLGDIDAIDVMRGVHLSQYFRGQNSLGLPPITAFLKPGCGFGGSCLPKDVKALIAHGKSVGEAMPLLEAIMSVNTAQPGKVVAILGRYFPRLEGVRVAVLGLSFKPGTNDVRESPAFPIMAELLRHGATVSAHDPVAIEDARKSFARTEVTYFADLNAALNGVDAVIVVTPWDDYRDLPALIRAKAQQPVFIDARRAFDRTEILRYDGVGLGAKD